MFARLIFRGVPFRQFCTTESNYSATANLFLEHLTEQFENLDGNFVEDVVGTDGVVTIKFSGNKVYVINKQTPNKQIWLSSPFSGPKRYELKDGDWVNIKDSQKLIDLLNQEINKNFHNGTPIEIK